MSHGKRLVAALALSMTTAAALAGNDNETANRQLPASYCLYDLGRLPGMPPGETVMSLTGLNNRNQAIGWITISGGSTPLRGFVWDFANGMRDLGRVPELPSTYPADINDAGTIVGEATDFETGAGRAIMWPNGGDLQQLDISLGGARAYAVGINGSGQIVGIAETLPNSSFTHAFLREPDGEVIDLGAFPEGDGISYAAAVNNRGWVVGSSNGAITAEAFIWDRRNGMRRLLENGGTLVTLTTDINDRGEVVGDMINQQTRAFRWTRQEGMQDIGALSGNAADYSGATGINRWGHIVGASQIETAGDVHAYVWSRRTGMVDLNQRIHPSSPLAKVAVIVIAQAINDAGWIVANGYLPAAADPRALALVPAPRSQTACP
jgi:probable HAF family extracellular repeat protein